MTLIRGLLSVLATPNCYAIWCPGCRDIHVLTGWQFNGDFDKPVFSPSLLVTSGHYCTDRWKPGDHCWCTYNADQRRRKKRLAPFGCQRCHSFIGCNGADPGEIIFLSDSTHHLAGKTVALPSYAKHSPRFKE